MGHVTLAFNMNHWNQQVINTKHGRHLKITSSGKTSTLMDLWIVIGHVQKRRRGKALYEFQRTASKLEDGKPVKGRQGRLTKTAIEKMKRSYGKAIRNNVNAT